MERPYLPLGSYYQLLIRHNLLADKSPLSADLNRTVSLVSCDSRAVIPGTLFVCKGAAFQPDYLRDAVQRGAFCYVSQQPYPDIPAPCLRVRDIRAAMGLMADMAYGHPSGKLHIAGITGTKGKTTAAYFLKSILDLWLAGQGRRASALLSTIVTDDGVYRAPAKLTTPEPLDLQQHLFHAASAGCGYLTMEISSQALKYGRVTGVDLDCAIFLNIGEDHISPVEHPDMEDYFQSKLRIFRHARTACINLDSDRAGQIQSAARACPGLERIVTFSAKDPSALVYAHTVQSGGDGIRFRVRAPDWETAVTLPMPGLFNIENALAAIAAAVLWRIAPETIVQGLEQARVPGRMEHYRSAAKPVSVIVDYAHNGMSLQALLRSVRAEFPGRQLTVLFGATGGKGLDRRTGMGEAAGQWADRILLTEDDPGPESVEEICAGIGQAIAPFGKTWTVIPDRETAVARAILDCTPPAVVVLAGKGCEQVQKRKNGPEPCVPDGMLAQKALRALDKR